MAPESATSPTLTVSKLRVATGDSRVQHATHTPPRPLLQILTATWIIVALLLVAPAAASGAISAKKSIWGPMELKGASQFPIYRDLGTDIYQMNLRWSEAAPTKPARATDPRDPAYQWPKDVDFALGEGRRNGIAVALQVASTPPWANGGREPRWAPTRVSEYADFLEAAARRYPGVRHWMIWGEPSRSANFLPLTPEVRTEGNPQPAPMGPEQRRAPRLYARLLDASYSALKRVSQRNVVIGGMTFTTGDISVFNWIRSMRLPNGKVPRMDLYGHNPFSARRPELESPDLGYGFADLSDTDTLIGWLDRYLRQPGGRRLRIFISELFWPTDHANLEFNFYVTRRTAAQWLSDALKITRQSSRIYSLGWFSLYDDPPRPQGDEVNRGLLDYRGRKKPAYYAYRRG